jgi:hypothetical protein
MPDWSIKIVGQPDAVATLVVDRNDVKPGALLQERQNDAAWFHSRPVPVTSARQCPSQCPPGIPAA